MPSSSPAARPRRVSPAARRRTVKRMYFQPAAFGVRSRSTPDSVGAIRRDRYCRRRMAGGQYLRGPRTESRSVTIRAWPMSAGGPLRIGVIGCGGIAQMMHLPTLAERPDLFTIAALADVSRPTLEAVGGRYAVTALATDYRELLARADVDAVLLLASGSHREAVVAALEAGKHVFAEKPLGFSLRETEAIAAAARGSRGRLMVGYHKRFDPHYLEARDEVRAMRGLRYVEV